MGTALTTDLAGRTGAQIILTGKKAIDLATTLDELKVSAMHDWTYGTGANQINVMWHDSRTTDDTGETHDIYAGGSLINSFGDALTMEAIKILLVRNTHATLTLEILGTVSTGLDIVADASDIIELPPGGIFYWDCPTAAGIVTITNKDLKFACKTAATISYDVAIAGLD